MSHHELVIGTKLKASSDSAVKAKQTLFFADQ